MFNQRRNTVKLKLRKDKNIKETIIDITYNIFDHRLKNIIEITKSASIQLKGEIRGRFFLIDSQDIHYIESVDNLTFLYTETEIYENKDTLYGLEDKLQSTSFIRINKSTILNMDYLESVSPLPNYRLETVLTTGEKLIRNRHYMKAVKEYLNI